MTDTTIIGSNARPGLSLGTPSPSNPLIKNYLGYANPGFEPMLMQQIYQFQGTNSNSSPTSFQWDVNNTMYASYDANQWANATFSVIQGSYAGNNTGDPALGCTGTIASSTNVSGNGPIFKINPTTNQGSNGCAGNLGVAGQLIVVAANNKMSTIYPTPAAGWNAGGGDNGSPFTPGLNGGSTLTSNTTDLCATCGTQTLDLNIPVGGSITLTASSQLNYPVEKTTVLNGVYTISFWAKTTAATAPQVLVTATPRSGTACSQTFNASSSQPITSTWTQFSMNCSLAETPSAGGPWPFTLQLTVAPVGHVATNLLFDNISMVNAGDTNPTIFDDAYVNALKAWCQSSNTTGPACTLRLYPPSPEAETMANWVLPSFEHRPEITNPGSIATAYSINSISLNDYLYLCKYINAIPVLNIPITMTTADAANLVDYLEGASGTTYGGIRASQGQSVPWVGASDSPFSVIYLEYGNENWNSAFLGNAIGYNTSSPTNNLYYDYALRAKAVFAAARAQQSSEGYSQTATKWVLGLQTAEGGDGGAMGVAKADVAEVNGYTGYDIQSVSTTGCFTAGSTNATCPLFGPTLTEPYSNTHDPNSSSGFRQILTNIQAEKTCGPQGNAQCQVMVYEENTGPNASTAGPFTQAVSDSFVQTGVQGVIAADQMGENDAAGVVNQNEFQAVQYYFNEGGVNVHMWGAMIDTGGDCSVTNASLFGGSYCPRPQMLGAQVYNWCKIGPMVATSWSGAPTYNLAANNNYVNAISNVPYLRSFAFSEGNQRCMVVVNTDIMNSRSISFAGSNAPNSGVTTYQFAPPSLISTNEAPGLSTTSTVQASMYNVMTPSVNVSSGYTLPAHSVTAFMWTVGGTPTAAAPTFSVAAGTYTSTQTVALSDSTSGATIYYTTNGTTPTTSSSIYTSALTVSSSETINAIAVASGYSNSSVSSATYTVNGSAAAPTFSLAPGTYTSAQTLTMADSTPGATMYYTTNGTTPTTSSTKYTGPVAIASTATVSALAVASGYSNSAVTIASFIIQLLTPTAATPVLSVASGTYSSAQSVTITDSTLLATIYYTTNGTTPTTSSTKYTGAILVSSSETLSAIAVVPLYNNSAVASATYTISASSTSSSGSSTPSINYGSGFSSSGLAFNGGSTVSGSALTLTDGNPWEVRSAWYRTEVAVNSFTTDFTFKLTNAAADGFTFTIQPGGTTQLGATGGGLGSQNLANSIAVKFDLYDNAGEGSNSTGVYENGAAPMTPATDLTPSGVNLHSGDSMHAHITYDGVNLNLTITDTVTGSSFNQAYPVNIPAVVGGNTAYVGFTGGSGSLGALQQILTWTYTAGTSGVTNPVFNPAAGTYNANQSVTITDATAGAKIYYTTDGSAPSTSSKLYSSPITVSSSETIRAIAVVSGSTTSSNLVQSAAVTATASPVLVSSSVSAAYVINAGAALINSPTGLSAGELVLNSGSSVSNGTLTLTTAGQQQSARSAWFASTVPVNSFTTDFVFQQTGGVADGMAFVIQNAGSNAVGYPGASLGYQSISKSVAVKFDLYNNAGEGNDSTGVYENGASPTIPSTDLSDSGVVLRSGHAMHAHIVYNGTLLTLTITDQATGASVTESYPVNIPAAVGGNNAYVGFTAGTGGSTSTQSVLTWTYTAQ